MRFYHLFALIAAAGGATAESSALRGAGASGRHDRGLVVTDGIFHCDAFTTFSCDKTNPGHTTCSTVTVDSTTKTETTYTCACTECATGTGLPEVSCSGIDTLSSIATTDWGMCLDSTYTTPPSTTGGDCTSGNACDVTCSSRCGTTTDPSKFGCESCADQATETLCYGVTSTGVETTYSACTCGSCTANTFATSAGVLTGTTTTVCTGVDLAALPSVELGQCTYTCVDAAKTDCTVTCPNGCELPSPCDGVTCPAANPNECQAGPGTCFPTSETTHVCRYAPATDGTGCDDGNASTVNDQCSSGVCKGTDPCAGTKSCGTTTCTGCEDCQVTRTKVERGWEDTYSCVDQGTGGGCEDAACNGGEVDCKADHCCRWSGNPKACSKK